MNIALFEEPKMLKMTARNFQTDRHPKISVAKAAQVTFGDADFYREIVAQEMGL